MAKVIVIVTVVAAVTVVDVVAVVIGANIAVSLVAVVIAVVIAVGKVINVLVKAFSNFIPHSINLLIRCLDAITD